jgi:hypothetical protein
VFETSSRDKKEVLLASHRLWMIGLRLFFPLTLLLVLMVALAILISEVAFPLFLVLGAKMGRSQLLGALGGDEDEDNVYVFVVIWELWEFYLYLCNELFDSL